MSIAAKAPQRSQEARPLHSLVVSGVLALVAGSLTACLGVTNPDIISPGAINNAAGAEALRNGSLTQLTIATGADDAANDDTWFGLSGLLADEWASSSTFIQHDQIDARNIPIGNALLDGSYRNLQRPRQTAEEAITALRRFARTAPAFEVAQMFNVQAYVENLLAETMCSGVPFSEIVLLPSGTSQINYGGPVATDSMYRRAAAHYDSALAADSTGDSRIFFAARVGLARVLLNQGRYVEAEAMATGVPTNFQWLVTFSPATVIDNANWEFNASQLRYSVGNNDGGNGLPFVPANDPRVPTIDVGLGFDSRTESFVDTLYTRYTTPTVLADGIEAQLIVAEGELSQGNTANWLSALNGLRAGTGFPAGDNRFVGLAPLVDPGTAVRRQNLQFKERAFWLFGAGHRLGDLRRLVRQYSRGTETVFPTGAFHKGGPYGSDVNFPIPQSEQNNPKFNGQCIDRNA